MVVIFFLCIHSMKICSNFFSGEKLNYTPENFCSLEKILNTDLPLSFHSYARVFQLTGKAFIHPKMPFGFGSTTLIFHSAVHALSECFQNLS